MSKYPAVGGARKSVRTVGNLWKKIGERWETIGERWEKGGRKVGDHFTIASHPHGRQSKITVKSTKNHSKRPFFQAILNHFLPVFHRFFTIDHSESS